MKNKFSFKKLSTKMLVYTLTPLVFVLIISDLIAIKTVRSNTTSLYKQELYKEAEIIDANVSSYFSTYVNIVSDVNSRKVCKKYLTDTNKDSEDANYTAAMSMLTDSLVDDVVISAWIYDCDTKNVICAGEEGVDNETIDFSNEEWYNKEKFDKGEICVSNPYEIKHIDESVTHVVALIQPITNTSTGDVLGAFAICLDIKGFSDIFEKQTLGSSGYTILFSSNGTVLYHPNQIYVYRNILELEEGSALDKDKISSISDNFKEYTVDGKSMYGNFSVINQYGWIVFSTIAATEIENKTEEIIEPIFIVFLSSILILIVIMMFIAEEIVKPIKKLIFATDEVANGRYLGHIDVSTRDEIGQLSTSFNNAIESLKYRAEYDTLTNIYNADTVYLRTLDIITSNLDTQYAIVQLDVNHFKYFNGMFGRREGDKLLKYIATTLRDELPEGSIFGRMMGDIFCFCVPFEEELELIELTKVITSRMDKYPLTVRVVVAFGICVVEKRNTPINVLFDCAGTALKSIKANLVVNYAFYDYELKERMAEERRIEQEMKSALEYGQFHIYFQPKCDIPTGKIVGAESLIRWIHPVDGVISPTLFIPLFEKNGFVMKIDEYVWEETCKLIREWLDKGYEVVPVSINASRVHIYDPTFCDKMCGLIDRYNIPKNLIEIEITESAFLDDVDELKRVADVLKSKGLTLSMDDFGSGFSSLNMLKSIPLDVVKIDREFINEIVATRKGKIIMRSTIQMLRKLEIKIIAEGVETKEQADFLYKCGCHIAQGYLYSKPVDAELFEYMAYSDIDN